MQFYDFFSLFCTSILRMFTFILASIKQMNQMTDISNGYNWKYNDIFFTVITAKIFSLSFLKY